MKQSSAWPTDDMERILNTYGDMLYRLCLIMLKNESDAEDAVQETMIKYYQKAPAFADPEHFRLLGVRIYKITHSFLPKQG